MCDTVPAGCAHCWHGARVTRCRCRHAGRGAGRARASPTNDGRYDTKAVRSLDCDVVCRVPRPRLRQSRLPSAWSFLGSPRL